jgi:putative phosphoribosyl transferase
MSTAMAAGEVSIPAGRLTLLGNLDARGPHGTIIFAHGSGSGRASPRNLQVARVLQQAGFSTLLIDLLTPREAAEDERTRRLRFDIPLLAKRMIAATDWLSARQALDQPIGFFGASTGAAAALIAASQRSTAVHAVVSRGGRPDLAWDVLPTVRAATLLLVGGHDEDVLALNRDAYAALTGCRRRELVVIPGATHLFEEPGALDQVAACAVEWFEEHAARR